MALLNCILCSDATQSPTSRWTTPSRTAIWRYRDGFRGTEEQAEAAVWEWMRLVCERSGYTGPRSYEILPWRNLRPRGPDIGFSISASISFAGPEGRKRQGVEDEASDIAQASCEERSF